MISACVVGVGGWVAFHNLGKRGARSKKYKSKYYHPPEIVKLCCDKGFVDVCENKYQSFEVYCILGKSNFVKLSSL